MVFRYLALLSATLLYNFCKAQDSSSYYLVYLKDKPILGYSIDRPLEFLSQKAIDRRIRRKSEIGISDIPVSTDYLSRIGGISGIHIINRSKWLNAVEIKTNGDFSALNQLKMLDFVSRIEFLGRIRNRPKPFPEYITDEDYQNARILEEKKKEKEFYQPSVLDYGKSLMQNRQLGINELHQYGLGNSIHIAVFDAGFFNAYKVKGMEDLLLPGVIIRDFVDYDNSVWEDDRHGASVLSFMKSWNPGFYIGSAPMAEYTLIRTENQTSEYPVEEVNWLFAAEFADSLGVEIIVSSLGYHTFDDVTLNHTYYELDGKTSIVARAAGYAYEKGIMVVTSAGNEGLGKWHRIGTPSDARGVIGIGACDENGFHVKFSSIGPSADKRIKPDFLALGYKAMVASPNGIYGGNGTSYSTPIFGGAMACIMHICPDKSFEEIKSALRQSATHSFYPDSAYGYGLPDFKLALHLLGYCEINDTITDFLYNKTNPVFFQDLGIHFRSKSTQTVKMAVTGLRKKKFRSIFKKVYKIEAGDWIHEGMLFDIYRKELINHKKHKLRELVLLIETENGTIQKTISLSYE